MKKTKITRRKFLEKTALSGSSVLAASVLPFNIMPSKPKLEETILGHGDFKYRLEKEWGDLDPKTHPVKNCHEMVMDKKGRLLLLTDHPQNNMLIYNTSGNYLKVGRWIYQVHTA